MDFFTSLLIVDCITLPFIPVHFANLNIDKTDLVCVISWRKARAVLMEVYPRVELGIFFGYAFTRIARYVTKFTK